jgi:hypothetical protein
VIDFGHIVIHKYNQWLRNGNKITTTNNNSFNNRRRITSMPLTKFETVGSRKDYSTGAGSKSLGLTQPAFTFSPFM